jgi:hypothetical protein
MLKYTVNEASLILGEMKKGIHEAGKLIEKAW